MFKRFTDIIFGGFLLILAIPLLIVAAILIKVDSPGPILFVQTRMGRGCRPFRLYKLRSMRTDMIGTCCTLGNDPRITRSGYWLRWLKLDEVPQLWNVLRGDMSLVGPRPMIPEITREFQWAYEKLLLVRPGLTDPATLKYCRETEILAAVSDPEAHLLNVVVPDKLRLSMEYIDQANAWRDMLLILQTPLVLAFGIRQGASELVMLQIRQVGFSGPQSSEK